jgi:methionyl-tRNA formyltransferase
MKLVVAATPNVAIPTIKNLKQHHEVVVVTQPDRPSGRGKQLKASDVSLAFPEVLKPESEHELQEILIGKDLLITIGYGRLLKLETLQTPKCGGINLHFSLLPKWRGAAPVQRAIEAGDQVTGVTVFQMDAGMDTGAIWHQIEYQIPLGYSSRELFGSLSAIGVTAVNEALEKIALGATPTPQTGEATIARKVVKSECVIDWHAPAEEIVRKIKAFAFNPGVTTSIRNTPMKISDATSGSSLLNIGELNASGEVGTGSGSVQLLHVIPAGKREMSVKEWLNGFKLQPGEQFE